MSEPLRDLVGRAIYEEPGSACDWAALSDERREHWRKDADRVIPIIAAEYAAVLAERRRAQEACELMGQRLSKIESVLQEFISAIDAGHAPYLETYDRARNVLSVTSTHDCHD